MFVGLYIGFCVVLKMNYNVLALGAVADFGAQNCQYTTKVDARQNVHLTTSPAIEPNACYRLVLLFLRPFFGQSCGWTD